MGNREWYDRDDGRRYGPGEALVFAIVFGLVFWTVVGLVGLAVWKWTR